MNRYTCPDKKSPKHLIMYGLRDISKFMKEHNVLGSSRGYIQRIVDSYSSVTVEKVQKYFLSTLKFCQMYVEGATGFNVNDRMKELRKQKKCHRGPAMPQVDHTLKRYNRNRLNTI